MHSLIANAIHELDRQQYEITADAGQTIPCDDDGKMVLIKGREPQQKPEIFIAGCGETGNSVINCLFHGEFSGPRTMVVDHDRQTFDHCHASSPFLVKSSNFRSEDHHVHKSYPDLVAAAMEKALPELEKKIGDPDLCIVVAGLSGDAGTGAASAIARLAKARGSTVAALVTLPTRFDKSRYDQAKKELEGLLQAADTVYVLEFSHLMKVLPGDLPVKYVYPAAVQILADCVRNLYERICTPSMVNLNFNEVIHIINNGGYGTILAGETRESNFVEGVLRECRNNRMGDLPYSTMTGCIIFIDGYYCGLFYSEEIATGICRDMDPHAEVIWGVHEDHAIPEGETRAYALVSTGKKEIPGGC
jgi:cell division protein FtsZ